MKKRLYFRYDYNKKFNGNFKIQPNIIIGRKTSRAGLPIGKHDIKKENLNL